MIAYVASLVGYFGAAVLSLAYLFNQSGMLRSDGWRFPALNLAGSLLIIVSLIYETNPPSVVIEVFWSAISIYGVWKNLRAAKA